MMGKAWHMLVYLVLLYSARHTTACSICSDTLKEVCSNFDTDENKLSAGTLLRFCADNIYERITYALAAMETQTKDNHIINHINLSTVCNSPAKSCQDLEVISYTTIKRDAEPGPFITISLLPVAVPCNKTTWRFHMSLEVYVRVGENIREWRTSCTWGVSNTGGLNIAPNSQSQTEPLDTTQTSGNVTSSGVTSDGTTRGSVTSKSVTSEGVTSPAVAAIACGTFMMGVICSLAAIFILRMKRQNKLCFRVAEEPSPGKWEGASTSVTTKVIAKHSKSQDKGDQYEDLDKKTEISAVTSDQTYDTTPDNPRDSHVYLELAENTTNKSDTNVENNQNDTRHVYTDLLEHNLYESGRESTDSYFPNNAFRNSNFAADKDIAADDIKGDKRVGSMISISNHAKTTSVQLGGDHVGDSLQQTQVVTNEVMGNSGTETNDNGNPYFILEKENSEKETSEQRKSEKDHTYFVLEGNKPNC